MTHSMPVAVRPKSRSSGNSIIELVFMLPWLLFLFVGVFDFGFYAYALIATQNAARAVAVHNSISKSAASDPDGSGCQIAIFELQNAAYGRPMSGCGGNPLLVTSTWLVDETGIDLARVNVKYWPPPLFPIPGIPNFPPIQRTAQMMVNPSADF